MLPLLSRVITGPNFSFTPYMEIWNSGRGDVHLSSTNLVNLNIALLARGYEPSRLPWKVSKYGVFSSLYFPVFGLNTGKYGLEKTSYLDAFHANLEGSFPFFKCPEYFAIFLRWYAYKRYF